MLEYARGKLYTFISESPAQAFLSGFIPWIIFYLYLYFSVYTLSANGQVQLSFSAFAAVNPVVLYAIPGLILAVMAGATGGKLFSFLEGTALGGEETRKRLAEGALYGLGIGAVTVVILYFLSPAVNAIVGLSITPLQMIAAADPVPLTLLNFYDIGSIFNPSFLYVFLLFWVVAFSEEYFVLVTYKLFRQSFYSVGLSLAGSMLLAAFLAGILWGGAHVPAYTFEGVPVILGIVTAILIGTLAFRLLSQVIFGNFNIAFMVTSHFMYDFGLATFATYLSFVPIHP